MQQPFTPGSGQDNLTYTALARIVDLEGRNWIEPLAQGGSRSGLERFADRFLNIRLVDILPEDPRHILMLQGGLDAPAVYRVNVDTGRGERVLQIADDESILAVVDQEERLRVKQWARFEGGDWLIGYSIFNPANGRWEEHQELQFAARTRRNLQILGFDPQDENLLLVADNRGANLTFIRDYDLSTRAFGETLFAHPRWEASNVVLDNVDGNPANTRIVGFTYLAGAADYYWVDEGMAQLHARLKQALGTEYVRIGARYGAHRLIVASDSTRPPNYYLLTNETVLSPLGSSNPLVDPTQLRRTELVYYPARDGLQIPAFLTLPLGWTPDQGPLPVMIQPHGGPWSRNTNDWGGQDIGVAQYFASRGWAVLEPQFRGSDGFGDQLWKAGDQQWGLAMQDDKDDGLAYLVSQGIGDPNRAVMYGFSYGGFSAIAASVRPNSPYRCAISGAGVSSVERISNDWGEDRIQRRYQGWTVDGMDPLANASAINIPLLLYHGDRDQTATLWHSQRFYEAARSHGNVVLEIIEDMPHGALTVDMRRQEMRLVEDFLRGTCGVIY
jgi:dipeptidyl aminopeptidase/acylaminoacyl peptidase